MGRYLQKYNDFISTLTNELIERVNANGGRIDLINMSKEEFAEIHEKNVYTAMGVVHNV
jgi:predicted RNA-binding protein Jag